MPNRGRREKDVPKSNIILRGWMQCHRAATKYPEMQKLGIQTERTPVLFPHTQHQHQPYAYATPTMAIMGYETHSKGGVTATSTASGHKLNPSKHIFKLAYALALPGRFHRNLARFINCAFLYEHNRQTAVDNGRDVGEANRACEMGFHEACLLVQGFYQVESDDDADDADDADGVWRTLPHRIDRVWAAARMFLLRGMVGMGDGDGNLVERVEAVPNAATHASVQVPVYDDDAERALGPDLAPNDLPSLMPRWNKMALPAGDVPPSDTFLWACAGCTLGTHCIPVPEWRHRDPVDRLTLTLESVTAKVAGVVRQLRFNERQRLVLEEKGVPREQRAVYLRHRRLWVPYPGPLALIPGPSDQTQLEATVTDLFRLLAAKEREHRLLQRVVGKPWMVAPDIRARVEAEATAEAMKGKATNNTERPRAKAE